MGNRLNQGFSNCGSVVNVLLLNVIFGVEKQMDWQIRYTSFCKLCKKTRSRPAV